MLHEASNKATSSLLAVQNQGKFLHASNIFLFGRPANRIEQLQKMISLQSDQEIVNASRLPRGNILAHFIVF